jgi:hypothetical protein
MPLLGIVWAIACLTQGWLGSLSPLIVGLSGRASVGGAGNRPVNPGAVAIAEQSPEAIAAVSSPAKSAPQGQSSPPQARAIAAAPHWQAGVVAVARETTSRLRQLQAQWLGPTVASSALDARNGFDLCRPSLPMEENLSSSVAEFAEATPVANLSTDKPGADPVSAANSSQWETWSSTSPKAADPGDSQPQGWLMGLSWLLGNGLAADATDQEVAVSYRANVAAFGDVAPFQVTARGMAIATFFNGQQAEQFAGQLRAAVVRHDFDPAAVRPGRRGNRPALYVGDRLLFTITAAVTERLRRDPDLVAVEWGNHIREAYGAKPFSLVDGQMIMYGLRETGQAIAGLASWYGPYFHGRLSANGETFSQYAMTAAHKTLPFGTFLLVENQESGDRAIVRVNDRGPYIGERVLDLSQKAALCLNSFEDGVVPVRATLLQVGS